MSTSTADSGTFSVSVDTGGTFADVVLLDRASGALWTEKTLSTPADPSQGFIDGILKAMAIGSVAPSAISHVFHGTTVATNAILESKGARAALVTSKGFRHVVQIGRHNVPRHVSMLSYVKPPPPVPARRIFEVGGRLSPSGEEIEALSEEDVADAAARIRMTGASAVAVCLLHSYANPEHERRVGALLRAALPDIPVTLSIDVLPVFREYERSMTALLNAYVMPLISSYVGRLEQRLRESGIGSSLLLMKSSGGVAGVDTIRRAPVETALSGPAAGAVGCALVGRLAGQPNLIGVDIGGTSADICLIANNTVTVKPSGEIGAWPLQLPSVDITTIGAGGGSIARLTGDGRLTVGPQSAGADPGPVSYGRGGEEPTVTDAHLALGRLPDYLLGGTMRIDREAARRAIEKRVAKPLGVSIEQAAEGILAIADNNMVGAIRVISVQRGHDPAQFALVPFGGAGPLHGVSLANLLGIPRVIVPLNPGVLSALGLLVTDLKNEFARVVLRQADKVQPETLAGLFAEIESEAQAWLTAERMPEAGRQTRWWADLRYVGQGSELRVPWPEGKRVDAQSLAHLFERFHRQHEQTFTFAQRDTPIELVTVAVEGIGQLPHPSFRELAPGGDAHAAEIGRQRAYFEGGVTDTPVLERSRLGRDSTVVGPAIVTQLDCTTVIPPGHRACVDSYGNLVVSRAGR